MLFILFVCFSLTLASDSALQELSSGNNLFTSAIYKEIKTSKTSNFFISPFSLETVLALVQLGAKDATAEELKTAAHLPTQDKLEAAFKTLNSDLKKNDTLYTFRSANKIYLNNDFKIKDNFKKIAVESFDADLENIDFKKKQEAINSINQWVEKQTENKIKNLITPEDIKERTKSVLINALYFKGNWSKPFKSSQTYKEDFYKNGKEVMKVDTMHDLRDINYYESQELKAKFLEIPFKGGDVTMVIILPNEKDGIFALENQMDKVLTTQQFSQESVNIIIPKFKIESRTDFKDILEKLGVKKAFKAEEADFSGISGDKGDLIIDKVIQKAFIEVGEGGVEAAAASFISHVVPLIGYFPSQKPKEFIADHPFIFYIKVKDLIAFAGRVVDPKQ